LPGSQFAIDVPETVIAQARAGGQEAFGQLYRWFERPVFTLALRICGNREDAKEVLQNTMLKLFDHLNDYRGESPFWSWLRQIAVNEALLRLRRQKRLACELGVEEDDLPEDHGPPPSAAADAAMLWRALDALPANTRSVLWLYHAEGYTHEEIAGLMQRTPSFSKSQLARGIRRLRALLQIEEPAHA
jgi:RNA polymerase sigma-70 factor (ECF subfamily)